MLLVGLPLLTCAVGLILLHWSFSNQARSPIIGAVSDSSNPAPPQSQRVVTEAWLASQSDEAPINVLELPEASLDFVGDWGGYTHSTIHSVVPGRLIGRNPDRVSIVFGRSGGTVYIGSELYTSPRQHLLRKPTARIANPAEAIIEYESGDTALRYAYTHSFRLLTSGQIAYREHVDVYEQRSGDFVGFVEQRATLKRLVTAREQILFARPSLDQVPRREVSSRRDFSAAISK